MVQNNAVRQTKWRELQTARAWEEGDIKMQSKWEIKSVYLCRRVFVWASERESIFSCVSLNVWMVLWKVQFYGWWTGEAKQLPFQGGYPFRWSNLYVCEPLFPSIAFIAGMASIQFGMKKTYLNTFCNPFRQSSRRLISLCLPVGPLMHRWNSLFSLPALYYNERFL